MSFYDIVLDFILMDAFDDLDNPPLSVKTVINNRWLSNSFKQTVHVYGCLSVCVSFVVTPACFASSPYRKSWLVWTLVWIFFRYKIIHFGSLLCGNGLKPDFLCPSSDNLALYYVEMA